MPSKRRPRLVTWLFGGVLIFAAAQITRLAAGLRLPDLPYTIPAWYFPATGGLWALLALLAAAALYRRMSWGPTLTAWISCGYALWYWVDRLWLAHTDYNRSTWPFALCVTVVSLAAVLLILNLQSTKRYYREDLDE